MSQKVVAIIQARLGSSRLPNKILADVCGHPMLWHVWQRVNKAKLIDEAIIAMPIGTPTDGLPKARYFFGNEDDVLVRFEECARIAKAQVIVRITADCPLIDPAIIDQMIEAHFKHVPDLTTNVEPPSWPDGQDIEVFSYMSLFEASCGATLLSDREHVTPWIKRHKRLLNVPCWKDSSSYRWTVDEQRDLDFVRAVYKGLWNDYSIQPFGMDDVLGLLRRQPELMAINSGIMRNEGLTKSLKEDGIVR